MVLLLVADHHGSVFCHTTLFAHFVLENPLEHMRLSQQRTDKVHMRLPSPETADELWKSLSPKVRNQMRKGQKQEFVIPCVVWNS